MSSRPPKASELPEGFSEVSITPAFLDEEARKFGLSKSSGKRAFEKQQQLYNQWIANGRKGIAPAKPGTSKHESGEAGDYIGSSEAKKKFYNHLKNNYGYVLSELLDEGNHIHAATKGESKPNLDELPEGFVEVWNKNSPKTQPPVSHISTSPLTLSRPSLSATLGVGALEETLHPASQATFTGNVEKKPDLSPEDQKAILLGQSPRLANKKSLSSTIQEIKNKPREIANEVGLATDPSGAKERSRKFLKNLSNAPIQGIAQDTKKSFKLDPEIERKVEEGRQEFQAKYGDGIQGGLLYALDIVNRPFAYAQTLGTGYIRKLGAEINAAFDSDPRMRKYADTYGYRNILEQAANRFYGKPVAEGFELPVEEVYRLLVEKAGGDSNSFLHRTIGATLGGLGDPATIGTLGEGGKLLPNAAREKLGIGKLNELEKYREVTQEAQTATRNSLAQKISGLDEVAQAKETGQIKKIKIISDPKETITATDDAGKTLVINEQKLKLKEKQGKGPEALAEGVKHEVGKYGHSWIDQNRKNSEFVEKANEFLDEELAAGRISKDAHAELKQRVAKGDAFEPSARHTLRGKPFSNVAADVEERFVEKFTQTGRGAIPESGDLVDQAIDLHSLPEGFQEVKDAQTIRGNKEKLSTKGKTIEGSEAISRNDLHQEGQRQANQESSISEGQEPQKRLDQTGIKNAITDAERAARGLAPIERQLAQDLGEFSEAGKKILASDPTFREQVRNWAEKPRPLTAEENAALAHDRLRLDLEYSQARDAYEAAMKSGDRDRISAAETTLARIEDLRNTNETASILTGSQWGKSGKARQMLLNRNGSLAESIQDLRVANEFKEVPRDIIEKMTDLHKQYEELQVKYEKALEDAAKSKASKSVKKVKEELDKERSSRSETRAKTKEALAKEWSDLSEELSKATRKAMNSPSALGASSADIAKVMTKMMKNLVERGVVNIEEIIDHIHTEARKYVEDISRREVAEALSGYGREVKPTRSELTRTLNDLNKQMRLILSIEDVRNGIQPKKITFSLAKKSPEVIQLEQELKQAMVDSGMKKPRLTKGSSPTIKKPMSEESKLKAYKSRTEARIKEIEEQIAKGDFSEKPKMKLNLDKEAENLKLKLEQVKARKEKLKLDLANKNKHWGVKSLDFLVALRRMLVLSSAKTMLLKLPAAAAENVLFDPVYDIVGEGLRHVPGLRKTFAEAPIEGQGFVLKAQGEQLAQFWRTAIEEDWKDIIKTGKTSIDRLYGHSATKLDPELMNIFGHLHAAIKALPKRAGFYKAMEEQAVWAARRGLDIHDPLVMAQATERAYNYANRRIFLENNLAVRGFNNLVGWLDKQGPLGKTIAAGARWELPIVKVPTNMIKQSLQHSPIGLVQGVTELAIIRGIRKAPLTPEAADRIARALKVGSVGTAMNILGWYGYQDIGGLYDPKREEGDVRTGGIRMFGIELPAVITMHHPALIALQVGATMRRIYEKSKAKGEKPSFGMAALESGAKLVEEVPFFNAPKDFAESMQGGKKLQRLAAKQTLGSVLPVDIPASARALDSQGDEGAIHAYIYSSRANPREINSIWDAYKEEIPWWRETLPLYQRGSSQAEGFQIRKPSLATPRPVTRR